MTDRSVAEVRATGIIAVAKALVDAANDFGEGNQIAGDVWTLAAAAFDAAASTANCENRQAGG